jgi:hypothetical protein
MGIEPAEGSVSGAFTHMGFSFGPCPAIAPADCGTYVGWAYMLHGVVPDRLSCRELRPPEAYVLGVNRSATGAGAHCMNPSGEP